MLNKRFIQFPPTPKTDWYFRVQFSLASQKKKKKVSISTYTKKDNLFFFFFEVRDKLFF